MRRVSLVGSFVDASSSSDNCSKQITAHSVAIAYNIISLLESCIPVTLLQALTPKMLSAIARPLASRGSAACMVRPLTVRSMAGTAQSQTSAVSSIN
jgi:hypothetical protein